MLTSRFELPPDPLLAARRCLEQRMPAGDPAQLRTAARQAGATAEELRRTAAVLLASLETSLWSGPAHRAFAEQVRAHAPSMSAAAERYEHCAGLLSGYAAALDETAPRLTSTRGRLRQRCEELAARGFAQELASPVGAAGLGPARPDTADLLPLARDFKACYDRWADALDRCLLALRQAGEAGSSHDRHGLAGFGHRLAGAAHRQLSTFERAVLHPSLHNLSDCLGTLNTDLSVLGLGLLLICPPAATACLVTPRRWGRPVGGGRRPAGAGRTGRLRRAGYGIGGGDPRRWRRRACPAGHRGRRPPGAGRWTVGPRRSSTAGIPSPSTSARARNSCATGWPPNPALALHRPSTTEKLLKEPSAKC